MKRREDPERRSLEGVFGGMETRMDPWRVEPAVREVVLVWRVTYLEDEFPMVEAWFGLVWFGRSR
jgi:hypothetical protein